VFDIKPNKIKASFAPAIREVHRMASFWAKMASIIIGTSVAQVTHIETDGGDHENERTNQ
jgi:hypothetical protein